MLHLLKQFCWNTYNGKGFSGESEDRSILFQSGRTAMMKREETYVSKYLKICLQIQNILVSVILMYKNLLYLLKTDNFSKILLQKVPKFWRAQWYSHSLRRPGKNLLKILGKKAIRTWRKKGKVKRYSTILIGYCR